MTTKQRLAQVRADLSEVIAELVRGSKSRKMAHVISRGTTIGALTAAEIILVEVLRDMDPDEGLSPPPAAEQDHA